MDDTSENNDHYWLTNCGSAKWIKMNIIIHACLENYYCCFNEIF